jgi:nitrogen regulatory protein P-II 1
VTVAKGRLKKIEAIIQPFKLDEVNAALHGLDIEGLTMMGVRGHGRQKGHTEVCRGQENNLDLPPKVKVEVVIPAARFEEVVSALMTAATARRKIAGAPNQMLSALVREALSVYLDRHPAD